MEDNLDLDKNQELNRALLEFQVDNIEQTKKSVEVSRYEGGSRMISWVMKIFNIKEEKYANYILIFFALVAIYFSLYLVFGNNYTGYPNDIKIIPAV
ncbi:MAG: hypothetical protein NDI62_01105 [Burkholderiales bacterium]|nr:hypothetical protein [Burkholderiales bacterium]